MKAIVTTTITTTLDIDSMTPSHDVDIHCDDGLPESLVLAIVEGGCNATLSSVREKAGKPKVAVPITDDEEN